MTDSLSNAGLFLINTLFDIYLLILMTRLILAFVHADYFSPLTQVIVKVTKPIINPLRRFLPTFLRIETATLTVIFVLEIVKFLFIGLLTVGIILNPLGLMVLAIGDSIKLLLNTFFYAILLQAILSWIQPGYSPITRTLTQLTDPIMRPIRRIVPPIGGFDLSPIPALILLQLLIILIPSPLLMAGKTLALR